ncbi:MAG: PAS domain S-box protein [Candidatus Hydrogenedentes bacterium]|nr:PAS domain S-box protein [Candidatus Hydrogenedentota bacterium]
MAGARRASIPLYLIPIMLGMCGVLFAQQLPNPILQTIVIVLSVGMPLFAVGILMTRIHGTGYQRIFLLGGGVLLVAGALATVAGIPEGFAHLEDVPAAAGRISRVIGITSLILGLLSIVAILARREEQIEEVGQRFKYLAEHMSEGFILTAPDGTITLVNDALTKLTGLSESELVGKNDQLLARKLDLEPMLPHIEDRRRGIASEYHVAWSIRGEERQLWVNGTPLFDRRGNFAGALATIRDVTEQHRLAQRLEKYTQGLQKLVEDRTQKLYKSQQRLRDLLVNMNEGFMTIDASYHVWFANSRICEMLQLTEETLLGRDLFEFVEPSGRGRLLEVLENAHARRGFRQHQELVLSRPGGEQVSVMASIAPIDESPEEMARYSLVMTDVSALKHMQRQLEVRALELEEANAELRMLDRAKDSFLSNVSHELRTPLSTIRGYLEMFDGGTLGALDETQTAALKVVMRNAERLGTLIDEIIEYSRMEIRGIQLDYTLFSVSRVLQECAASVKPQLLARELSLTVTEGKGVHRMWGDRKRVAQALAILLSNALKFSEKGDRIELAVAARDDGTVLLSVADTGIGIDKESQKRVFDKFYQADSSHARRFEGAGIGLSIAKSIMDAHRGHIELVSEPGAGSTFTLVFPHAFFETAEAKTRTSGSVAYGTLLVTHDVELGSALQRVLANHEYVVSIVSNAFEGARMLREHSPSIVLINDEPPSFDANANVARLREAAHTADFPLLVITDRSRAEEHRQRVAQGMYDVMFRPFTADELVARLAMLLGRDTAAHEREVTHLEFGQNRVALLCVSPDRDLQDWIETAMKRRGFASVRAFGCNEAVPVLEDRHPDVVLVDLDVSEDEVACVTNTLMARAREMGCALYVMTGLSEDALGTLTVNGVLTKPFSTSELVEAIAAATAHSA